MPLHLHLGGGICSAGSYSQDTRNPEPRVRRVGLRCSRRKLGVGNKGESSHLNRDRGDRDRRRIVCARPSSCSKSARSSSRCCYSSSFGSSRSSGNRFRRLGCRCRCRSYSRLVAREYQGSLHPTTTLPNIGAGVKEQATGHRTHETLALHKVVVRADKHSRASLRLPVPLQPHAPINGARSRRRRCRRVRINCFHCSHTRDPIPWHDGALLVGSKASIAEENEGANNDCLVVSLGFQASRYFGGTLRPSSRSGSSGCSTGGCLLLSLHSGAQEPHSGHGIKHGGSEIAEESLAFREVVVCGDICTRAHLRLPVPVEADPSTAHNLGHASNPIPRVVG